MEATTNNSALGSRRGGRRWRRGLVAMVTASAVLLGAAGTAGATDFSAAKEAQVSVKGGGGASSTAGVRW